MWRRSWCGRFGSWPNAAPGITGMFIPFASAFSAAGLAPSVDEVGAALAQHLHLAADEDDARLEALAELVIERRAPILDDQRLAGFFLLFDHDRRMLARTSRGVHLVRRAFSFYAFARS